MKQIFLFILLNIITISKYNINAQEKVAIGDWRGHFPYNSLISVTSDGNHTIYAASPYSMFSYDTETGMTDIYSKINNLSDVDISCIKYSTKHNVLVVAYANGNIDLIKDGKVINMNDIYRSNIIGNKTINNIYLDDNHAYLSCGFGIVVIDILRDEVAETYYIGTNGTYVNVYDLAYMPDENKYFAATDKGIYSVDAASNLSNFENWHKIDDMPSKNSWFNTIEYFAGKLLANVHNRAFKQDTMLIYDGSGWTYFFDDVSYFDVRDMSVADTVLTIAMNYGVETYNADFEQIHNYWQYSDGVIPTPNAAMTQGNICWIADNEKGLAKATANWEAQLVMPSGPEVAKAFRLVKNGDKIFSLTGGYNLSWVPVYNKVKYSVYQANRWTTVSSAQIPEFQNYTDVTDIAVDPRDPDRIFLASYSFGLIEINDGEIVKVHNGYNSPLHAPTGYTEEGVRCGGLYFDRNNNLWVSHALGTGMLNVLKADNTWANYPGVGLFDDLNNKEVSEITVDTYNQKWLKSREYATIYVLNDGGTIDNPNDDKWRALTNSTGNGALTGLISDIAVDNEGDVWIGSDLGMRVIYYPDRIFEGGNFDAQEILIDLDGTVRPLFESESVTAIAVDYGNNKWVGTASSGLYYISPDGTEEFAHFTRENSKLLSNEIIDITIDVDGEVFISTSKGICSFKGQSSEPQETNSGIYAYPNPVRPDYHGKIAVTGLIDDAVVKIADFSGNIVYSQRSNGGMITWDGNLPSGERAATGIYVVFATDANGKQRAVTKIAFIK